MIWRYRSLVLCGVLLVCGGLNWTYVVLVKEGRGFDDLETIQALFLLGGGFGSSNTDFLFANEFFHSLEMSQDFGLVFNLNSLAIMITFNFTTLISL